MIAYLVLQGRTRAAIEWLAPQVAQQPPLARVVSDDAARTLDLLRSFYADHARPLGHEDGCRAPAGQRCAAWRTVARVERWRAAHERDGG
jgi:hypothetical protein